MDLKKIESLIEMITEAKLSEFKMKSEELEISIRTHHYQKQPKGTIVAAPSLPASAPAEAPAAEQAGSAEEETQGTEDSSLIAVKSPIVGTFYRASAPDKPPFVKIGDTIQKGDVVCIVEAMKLFNEIESEVSGKVVKVVTEDASPVEYDQVLFLVDPAG